MFLKPLVDLFWCSTDCRNEVRNVAQSAWTPGTFFGALRHFQAEAEVCASNLLAGELSGYKGCVSMVREALSH